MGDHSGATAHVGRYEVIGRIARGGMAEIVLGRLLGPSGFERAVVIKRILPHLAEESAFVDMFLDEARIAARIRHANVVQVHELGQQDDELFIVMEYLEGESVLSLLRRLSTRRETLPPRCIAYVCAAAAAGLHAAHELTDDDGLSEGVVHRDISPQNIFVTYDGGVKVLDFGIAKAAGRITKTEAGELKGKFAYMSPEQVRGRSLDRRSDVFALGVVLYEMLTGKRLFKRPSQVATIEAVRQGPIPSPLEVAPDCPPALASICMKALRRSRKERYGSAAELRRELLAFATAGDHTLLAEEELGAIMVRYFADRIEEKRDMLRRCRAGSSLTHVPAGETDEDVSIPTVDVFLDDLEGTGSNGYGDSGSASDVATAAPPQGEIGAPKGRRLLVVLGLLVAVGVGAAAARWMPSAETPSDESTLASDDNPPVQGEEGDSDEDPNEVEAEPEPEPVLVRVDSEPGGATLWQGEERLGVTPVMVPPTTDHTTLRFELAGHEEATWEGTLQVADGVQVTLTPAAAPDATQRDVSDRPSRSHRSTRMRNGSRSDGEGTATERTQMGAGTGADMNADSTMDSSMARHDWRRFH